jgi:anti-anti-sigma factor
VEGGLFFANADAVRKAVRAEADRPDIRAVILDAETVPFVDVTALRMLIELADTLEISGVRFAIAHDIGQVRDLLREDPSTARIPIYPSVEEAVRVLSV